MQGISDHFRKEQKEHIITKKEECEPVEANNFKITKGYKEKPDKILEGMIVR